MQELKSKDIEGRYVNYDGNRTILATWENPTLLVLDFYDSTQQRFKKVKDPDGLLGTLKVQVK